MNLVKFVNCFFNVYFINFLFFSPPIAAAGSTTTTPLKCAVCAETRYAGRKTQFAGCAVCRHWLPWSGYQKLWVAEGEREREIKQEERDNGTNEGVKMRQKQREQHALLFIVRSLRRNKKVEFEVLKSRHKHT